ncbi:FapA family protein [Virgibacillus byunsanensis]|uniref:FapA family protein n=1 Tax=Virgibacillus byunsanensis TaxID=570945 RepID=A0ABW3LM12_9BACI
MDESLSLKNGNLDFVGSITIHGDVPTGYTVNAKGDIKIYGMVEAATLTAGGSIFISEGLAGLQKGYIKAVEDIHVGYINQGIVYAGSNIYVESSITHSQCVAKNHIYCQRGNIIGGTLSAGKSIEAKDIGNRLSSKTEIIFGINKTVNDREKRLIAEKKVLQDTLQKLSIIGEKLKSVSGGQDVKQRIALLKQRNSYNKTLEKLAEVEKMLQEINAHLGNEHEAVLNVNGHIHPKVIVAFGKYQRKITKEHQYVQMKLERNEISFLSK